MSNIYSLITQIISSATSSNAVILDALEELKGEAMRASRTFPRNLRNMQKRIDYLYDIFLDYDTHDQNPNREIIEYFRDTVGSSLDRLEEYIAKQEEIKNEMFCCESAFIELIINVLDSILQFQNTLNQLHPNASKSLIGFLGNLLIGIISTYVPVLGVILKVSGVVEMVQSFLDTENLTKVIGNWQEKLEKVKEKSVTIERNVDIKQKCSIVQQIAAIIDVPPVSIAELGLDMESLRRVHQTIEKDQKERESFRQMVDLFEEMPYTKKSIIEGVSTLSHGLTQLLVDKSGHQTDNLAKMKSNLLEALNPDKTLFERLRCCHKATQYVQGIVSDVRAIAKSLPHGEKLVTSCTTLVKKTTKNILPTAFVQNLISLSIPLKPLSEWIQLGNVMKVVLQPVISSSRSQGATRAKGI